MSRTARAVAGACAALLCAAPASHARPADDTPRPIAPYEGAGHRIVQIGDSNARGAQPMYTVYSRSEFSTSMNNQEGTSMKDHLGKVHTASLQDPAAIVIALVSNDARRDPWTLPGGWWERAFQLVRAGKPDCTVVVKPYLGKNPAKDVRASFWHKLTALVDRHEVEVFDWDARVRANPSWLLVDDLHYTPIGSSAYAESLMEAARVCTGVDEDEDERGED